MPGERDPAVEDLLAVARADFASRLPARITELEGLASRGVWDDARRAAHRLRGSSATYGFPVLGGLAAAIEDALLAAGGPPGEDVRGRVAAWLDEARVEAQRAAGAGR
jgi:HPt (histidine-containing phosphotransfer) domain-containing protein